MTELERACAQAIQADRQFVGDLHFLRTDVRAGATTDEIDQLLSLIIQRVTTRTTVGHAALWSAAHPEASSAVPPLLPLADAPSSAQSAVVRTSSTDCRSVEGVTVGLIDALISILRVVVQQDLTQPAVREALLDLANDSDLQVLLRSAQFHAAGVCAQTPVRVELPVGPALNALVAQLLGYTVYHYNKDVPQNCYYCLMTPDFNPVVSYPYRAGERRTEAEAWTDAPDFCGDDAEARTILLDFIEHPDRRIPFLRALEQLVVADGAALHHLTWCILRATNAQLCFALLAIAPPVEAQPL